MEEASLWAIAIAFLVVGMAIVVLVVVGLVQTGPWSRWLFVAFAAVWFLAWMETLIVGVTLYPEYLNLWAFWLDAINGQYTGSPRGNPLPFVVVSVSAAIFAFRYFRKREATTPSLQTEVNASPTVLRSLGVTSLAIVLSVIGLASIVTSIFWWTIRSAELARISPSANGIRYAAQSVSVSVLEILCGVAALTAGFGLWRNKPWIRDAITCWLLAVLARLGYLHFNWPWGL
jgi:hypothetical protein